MRLTYWTMIVLGVAFVDRTPGNGRLVAVPSG